MLCTVGQGVPSGCNPLCELTYMYDGPLLALFRCQCPVWFRRFPPLSRTVFGILSCTVSFLLDKYTLIWQIFWHFFLSFSLAITSRY